MKLNFLLPAILCTSFSYSISAQQAPTGTWIGTLDVGTVKLRIVFHIKNDNDSLTATMDSPDQGAKNIPVSSVRQKGDSLLMKTGPLAYYGQRTNDSTIDGELVQGQHFPLALHRSELVVRKRPQTPVPPFPYKSENLVFYSPDNTIKYGATITAPKDALKHPALLLITGSGQQNRDEEIMEHKPFAVIADYLTRRGYVVLRVDDRGTGQTTGDLSHATSLDFSRDAATAIDYLKQRPEVDVKRLGLMGHSEGGMIATMLAAGRSDIAFIISMAGPGTDNIHLLEDQNDALMKKRGLPDESRKAYRHLYSNILHQVSRMKDTVNITGTIEKIIADWRKTTPEGIVLQTTGISDEASQHNIATTFSRQFSIPWFRYFIAYDPAPDIKKLRCKVLALNGSNDIQVVAGSNLAGWRAALGNGHPKSSSVKELPGLNHLFQKCNRCDLDEYSELEQTISPETLETIGGWLDKEVKY